MAHLGVACDLEVLFTSDDVGARLDGEVFWRVPFVGLSYGVSCLGYTTNHEVATNVDCAPRVFWWSCHAVYVIQNPYRSNMTSGNSADFPAALGCLGCELLGLEV